MGKRVARCELQKHCVFLVLFLQHCLCFQLSWSHSMWLSSDDTFFLLLQHSGVTTASLSSYSLLHTLHSQEHMMPGLIVILKSAWKSFLSHRSCILHVPKTSNIWMCVIVWSSRQASFAFGCRTGASMLLVLWNQLWRKNYLGQPYSGSDVLELSS